MEPQSNIYCEPCSLPRLATWKGWPNRNLIPLLPRLIDGCCETCAQPSASLDSSRIGWQNVHGYGNTGLPDHWRLVVDTAWDRWGLPYFGEAVCHRCGQRAVVSEHMTRDLRLNCPQCGIRRLSAREMEATDLGMSAATLKARFKQAEANLSEPARVRIHRAISWLRRAESEPTDDDARFIFLWIAFNAAYAREFGFEQAEREVLRQFLSKLLGVDATRQLHRSVFEQYSGPVRILIENLYVFEPFWRALRTHDSSERWKQQFETSQRAVLRSVMGRDTLVVLSIVFDRLYVLRNQLVHGGSTWAGRVNRSQIRDGARLLNALVPIMIELLIDHPELDLGEIMYPVLARSQP